MREQLIRRCAFRTKISLVDRRFRIALDRNQFAILVINQLAASDAAVRTYRTRHFCSVDSRVHSARVVRHRLETCAVFAFTNLPDKRPSRKQLSQRGHQGFRSAYLDADTWT